MTRLPDCAPALVREIPVASSQYPFLGAAGCVCVAPVRGRNKVAAAFDLVTGEERWRFDTGKAGIAPNAAPLPGGGWVLGHLGKKNAVEVVALAPDGGSSTRIANAGDVSDASVDHALVYTSPEGLIAVQRRHDRAVMPGGGSYEGTIAGFAGESLILTLPKRHGEEPSILAHQPGAGWGRRCGIDDVPMISRDVVYLVNTHPASSRVVTCDALTGSPRTAWTPPHPIWDRLATPFALILALCVPASAGVSESHLTVVPHAGTVAAPPARLGRAPGAVDLIASDGARVLWISGSGERISCAPLSEPSAVLWEMPLPPDITGYDSYVKGTSVGRPPVIATDAGLLFVCRGRLALYQ